MKNLKKLLVVIMFVAFGSHITVAQNRESCVKHDSSRTIEEFKQVILTWKDPFISSQLWPAYAERVNTALQASKDEEVRKIVVTPDLKGMTWLMQYSFRHEQSHFVQEEYSNGVRINNELVFLPIVGQPSDWVVLEYKGVVCMYAKIACCNAEKPKVPVVAYIPPTPVPIPAPAPVPQTRVDTVKTVYVTEYYEGLRKRTPQEDRIQYEHWLSRKLSIRNVEIQRSIPVYHLKMSQQMRQPMAYRPQMRQQYCPPQRQYRPQPQPRPRPTYEPRTMPGGIPSIPTYNQPTYNPGSGGGLPSSPRSMPSGIQGRGMARF